MLGARIAALRKNADMSQAELAARLKISPSAVGMYEQGRREPAAEVLVAMAQIFGVTVDYLLTGSPRNDSDEETLTQLMGGRLAAADKHLGNRAGRSFSRQELAVLFAALLMEP